MSIQIKKILTPLLGEHISVGDYEMEVSNIDNHLVIFLPSDLIGVIRRNHRKFYNLSSELKCESLHFVRIDVGIKKHQKVSKTYLKTLATDIVFPSLIHGFYTESSDMGKNETYHVIVDSPDQEYLEEVAKVYTEITGMKSKFLVSNRISA
ncbi:hypothetical protein CDIK_2585 [Cucumispora dikerogammari]|nr:hypothetical protein CDIK_2585 [Cucumispora dikerogammari]